MQAVTPGRGRQARTRSATTHTPGAVTGIVAVLLAVLLGLTAAGCTADTTPPMQRSPALAHASAGAVVLTGGWVRKPASPDVAAAYFTLSNSADQPDTLVQASSPAARMVMAMKEVDNGGAMSMEAVPSLRVPAHGKVSLTPGHYHLMFEQVGRRLAVGDTVPVTLRFAHAGILHLAIPVVPLTGPPSMDDRKHR